MRYWYGYTGESLILGQGGVIRQIVPKPQRWGRLADEVGECHARYAARPHRRAQAADAETFTAALLAPLAVQALGVSSPPATPFSSAGQVLRLFETVNIEQAAINLVNGRIASAYGQTGGKDAAAARVARGFDDGDLLFLPRDTARLHAQETLNALPGAVVFLLSRSQAERQAFAGYLRHGTPPVISDAHRVAMASLRPTWRTWEREARLTHELLAKGCACTAHP